MRRLRSPHEQITRDSTVVVAWRFDEEDVADKPEDTYGNAAFTLNHVALHTGEGSLKADSPFSQETNGALRLAGAWLAPGVTGMAASFRTEWSLSVYLYDLSSGSGAATLAAFEYSKDASPTADELNMFGAYVTTAGDGPLSFRWDISTSTSQIIDTPVTLPGCFQFVHRAVEGSTTRGTFEVWKNGALAYTAASTWWPQSTSLTSNWILGGSRRYGNASGTSPAFVSPAASGGRGLLYDDAAFFSTALSPAKCRSIHADQSRPWDEAAMIRGGNYRVEHRVLVQTGDGSADWLDMRTFRDLDWTHEASVTDSVEGDYKRASIKLKRRFGRHLDLSRLNTSAEMTYEGSPMFDLRTRIRIEYAAVPLDWVIQGWEWAPRFDGLVDKLDWGGDLLELEACDLGCALDDVFRVDSKRYEYGIDSTTLARTHLQTLVDDNEPQTFGYGGSPGVTWGYLGGKPTVYTPVTPSWLMRYEHGGTGSVLKLLQGVADQIGWDVRYRPYEPLETDRLTFYEPPRNLNMALSYVVERADGFAEVRFAHPHGLQVGQRISITDTTNFNGSDIRVTELLGYDRIVTDHQPAGSPSAETSGYVSYGAHLTLSADSVERIGKVASDVADIRNHIVVRYDRKDSAATLPISFMEEAGGDIIVYFDGDADVSSIETGADATIDSVDAPFSGVRTVMSIGGNGTNSITITPAGGATGTSSTGIFSSEYLGFSTYIAISTPSVQRYGLRTAGMFEGSTEGVDTREEARLLGEGALSDMKDPTVDMDVDTKCLPWTDLHDLFRLETDPLGRWEAMDVAVVSYTDNYGARSNTSLNLRHDHPSKGRAWLKRNRGLLTDVIGWAPPNNIPANIIAGTELGYFNLDTRIGGQFMASWNRAQGKMSWLHDKTEIHVSTSSHGFLPRDHQSAGSPVGTLMDTVRGTKSALSYNSGQESALTPGETYFVKVRHRDKYGNLSGSLSGATAGYTMRYLTKPAAAFAYYASATSVSFHGGDWGAFPLNNKASSPAFDNYGNLSLQTLTGSAAFVHTASTGWVMPCNGTVQVEARLGFEFKTNGGKTADSIAIGLFLLGSGIPGSSSSAPFAFPELSSASPYACDNAVDFPAGQGRAIRLGTGSSYIVGGASDWLGGGPTVSNMTAIWVSFCHQISCNSGDRILVGARPGSTTTHCFSAAGGSSYSGSSPWIKYTLVSQD